MIKFLTKVTIKIFLLLSFTFVEARSVIQNRGSDTLVNIAQEWAEAYYKVDSDVVVAVSGGGSGTGIASMLNGTVDIANSSRQMKIKEMSVATQRGLNPVEHAIPWGSFCIVIIRYQP